MAKFLNIPLVRQEQTQWCWAACAVMVLRYYGSSVKQCELADRMFGLSGCCNAPSSSVCNDSISEGGICALYNDFGLSCNGYSGTITMDMIESEINQDRPVECCFKLGTLVSHAVVIIGYYDDASVLYMDPLFGETWAYYEDFANFTPSGYSGIWTCTTTGLTR